VTATKTFAEGGCLLTFTLQSFVIKVPLLKRLLSYVHPVRLREGAGEFNPRLEMLLYRGRLQLATKEALYSDGNRYSPALITVEALKDFLPAVTNVLVLGSGLGSLVLVMKDTGYTPKFTLVERDKVVLRWAMESLDDLQADILPVCADAQEYMQKNELKYDLIFIDIFDSMVVPEFVTTPAFLQQCHDSLSSYGRLAFNYIVHSNEDWTRLQNTFGTLFPGYKTVERGVNRVFIS
jgi:spermidine synthase